MFSKFFSILINLLLAKFLLIKYIQNLWEIFLQFFKNRLKNSHKIYPKFTLT